jgi:FkbM family methyltransferase
MKAKNDLAAECRAPMLVVTRSKRWGFQISYDSEDRFVGESVAQDTYEPFESSLFLDRLQRDSIVFDVGASIGYYTLLASLKVRRRFVFGKGKIVSFEPNLQNYLLLERNVRENHLDNVQSVNAAVGDRTGESTLFLSSVNQGDHQLYATANRRHEKVRTTTIDAFIAENKVTPSLVKIDTQGYDYFVLRGMSNLLKSSSKLTVFLEFWDFGNRNAGIDSRELFDYLRAFRRVEFIDEMGKRIYPATYELVMKECSKENGYNHANLLCSK